MDVELNPTEARVLGALIEKQHTTPEYYPLSLNALTTACNQKTNRNPVMSLLESDIINALDSLRSKRLAWELKTSAGRVTKYEHNLTPRWDLDPAEIAVLCILLLRGAQTVGEIRNRTNRIHAFEDLAHVEETLTRLSQREDGPFVAMLPRQPGEKECRYMHLFFGEPEAVAAPAPIATAAPQQSAQPGKLEALEENVARLREELDGLKGQFAEFKKQFE